MPEQDDEVAVADADAWLRPQLQEHSVEELRHMVERESVPIRVRTLAQRHADAR